MLKYLLLSLIVGFASANLQQDMQDCYQNYYDREKQNMCSRIHYLKYLNDLCYNIDERI